jgi:hypothetical protein
LKIEGPVLVLVFPKKEKKPDWTGPLNSSRQCPDRPPYQGPRAPYAGPSRLRTVEATIQEVERSNPPHSTISKVALNGVTTSAEEAIEFIKGLGDDVKDQVIQKVFMPQDF